jgi:hypothetical protein
MNVNLINIRNEVGIIIILTFFISKKLELSINRIIILTRENIDLKIF